MGSGFEERDIAEAKASQRLLSISLLLSDACNLGCLYCYRDAGTPPRNSLSLEQWKDVLVEAKELGARTVWIPGSGEPFLDPVFLHGCSFPLIEFSNSIGLPVTIFTNGTRLTVKLALALNKHNVSVVTKLNSFDPEIQDYLAGVRGASADIMRGLRLLVEAGFSDGSPTRLGIDTVIVAQNFDEIPRIFRFCRESNIVPYITVNLHGGRARSNTHLDVPREKLRDLFQYLLAIDRAEYGYDWFPSPPIVASQCHRLLYDVVVDSKGDVLVCPGIDRVIGSTRTQSLSHILHTSPFLAQVRRMPESLVGNCRNCDSKPCVYGCRLEARSSGDFFGPDPMCWHDDAHLECGEVRQ